MNDLSDSLYVNDGAIEIAYKGWNEKARSIGDWSGLIDREWRLELVRGAPSLGND